MSGEPWSGVSSSGPSGVWVAARAHSLVRNRRDPSAWPSSGKDQGYKPMVKALGGQRESDGVVVPLIGVQHNAPGGKGPNFDHARGAGKHQGMTGVTRSNYSGKTSLGLAVMRLIRDGGLSSVSRCSRRELFSSWSARAQGGSSAQAFAPTFSAASKIARSVGTPTTMNGP